MFEGFSLRGPCIPTLGAQRVDGKCYDGQKFMAYEGLAQGHEVPEHVTQRVRSVTVETIAHAVSVQGNGCRETCRPPAINKSIIVNSFPVLLACFGGTLFCTQHNINHFVAELTSKQTCESCDGLQAHCQYQAHV